MTHKTEDPRIFTRMMNEVEMLYHYEDDDGMDMVGVRFLGAEFDHREITDYPVIFLRGNDVVKRVFALPSREEWEKKGGK